MTGPPAPPSAIGTVGRISRSHDHTELSDAFGLHRYLQDDLR
jgi:hypothetical protein